MALSEIQNYIEDDWDDNNLTGRSNSEVGYFLHPSDNLISDYEAGDVLKGVYRPEWVEYDPNGVLSVNNGELFLDYSDGADSHPYIKTPSKWTTGTFKMDIRVSSTGSGGTDNEVIQIIGGDPSSGQIAANRWYLRLRTDGYFRFRKEVDGSITSLYESSTSDYTTTSTYKQTRSSYGGFESFKDGESLGTGTDTFMPPVESIVLNPLHNGNDVDHYYDNLMVN